ncbi:MAG TPA: hypothetical protein VJY62_04960 [Bacteroidia bacterium]|nr:hypothetical protein [Bacteroidia bacterium]
MSKTEKKRWFRYKSLLNMREPYEMTYWKQKLNAPHKKLAAYIRHLIELTRKTVPHHS